LADNKITTAIVKLIDKCETYHGEAKTKVVHFRPPVALAPIRWAPMVLFFEVKAAGV
jgi:hypothetical protein